VVGFQPRLNLQPDSSDEFNEALQNGDANQGLVLAEEASPEARPNMFQQVAGQFARSATLQRARQVAEKLSDPFQRDQVLRQAIRQSASNAGNQGRFASARQIAQEITPEEDRAILLAQLAAAAAGARQEALALERLEEAAGLLVNRPPNASTFAEQFEVAQALAHIKPARAVPLMERSARQIERVLAAAIDVDPFLPDSRSFEGGTDPEQQLSVQDAHPALCPGGRQTGELRPPHCPDSGRPPFASRGPAVRRAVPSPALGEQNIFPAAVSPNDFNFRFRIVE
jgi:hypothetical protein